MSDSMSADDRFTAEAAARGLMPWTADARLAALEERLPDATAIATSLTQIGQAVATLQQAVVQLQQQVAWLAQQRGVAEQQLERHTRATALDLAIKAAPGADAAGMTALADAFVAWLKAGAPQELGR